MGGSFLFERGEHFRRRDGQRVNSHSEGVFDRISDGPGDRNHGGFSDADDSAGQRVRLHPRDGDNFRHIGGGEDFIELHIGVDGVAQNAVHDTVFVEGPGNALDDATENLAFGGEFVDDETAVLDGDGFDHADLTGFRVDFHFDGAASGDAAA